MTKTLQLFQNLILRLFYLPFFLLRILKLVVQYWIGIVPVFLA